MAWLGPKNQDLVKSTRDWGGNLEYDAHTHAAPVLVREGATIKEIQRGMAEL